ncbi:MAG: hypothetical protein ABF802_04720 [Acetobacter orientalis]|uniref:hypothetical protein n=1 Tax=Acetobacter orientalis TaxID=146474 RepID=UPI0039E7F821
MCNTIAQFFSHLRQFFHRLGNQGGEPLPDEHDNNLPENKGAHVDDIRVMGWRVPEKANRLHNNLDHEICFQTQHHNSDFIAERSVLAQPL